MLLDLDVDCGPVLQGRELRLTGLRHDGLTDDAIHHDYSEHHEGKPVHPMVSLTYTLTPALGETRPDGRDVDVTVAVDPPLDPDLWPHATAPGAERHEPEGGVTRGAFGPFVLPEESTGVRVEVTDIGYTVNGVPPLDDGPQRPVGVLEVDLVTGSATWRAAEDAGNDD